MIENLFYKYPNSIFSFNHQNEIKAIHFWIKNVWEIPEELLKGGVKIQAETRTKDGNDPNKYYCILYSEPLVPEEEATGPQPNFEDLMNVFTSIFEHNLEKERKQELLQQKILHLQSMFKDKTYEELKMLDFQ